MTKIIIENNSFDCSKKILIMGILNITPDSFSNFTFPHELKEEVSKIVDNYVFDVQFRTPYKEQLLIDIYKMTKIHFRALKYMLKNKFLCVIILMGLIFNMYFIARL